MASYSYQIFIDCGCSTKDEVEKLGVHVGCVITYPDEFMILNKDKFVCRAIDNRMGGFMIAEVARLLKENKKKLPFGLYIVNSVQEEIGLRGAEMITQTIKPNAAIVTDVCHDTTTPMIEKKTQGDLQMGKGPVIAYAPAVHHNLFARSSLPPLNGFGFNLITFAIHAYHSRNGSQR